MTEYAKFTEIVRFTPADLVKKRAPEALFAVIDEGNVDYKVGIMGFKSYIDANFKVASFDWNVNRLNQRMANLERNIYVQTRLFQMKAIAKRRANSRSTAAGSITRSTLIRKPSGKKFQVQGICYKAITDLPCNRTNSK